MPSWPLFTLGPYQAGSLLRPPLPSPRPDPSGPSATPFHGTHSGISWSGQAKKFYLLWRIFPGPLWSPLDRPANLVVDREGLPKGGGTELSPLSPQSPPRPLLGPKLLVLEAPPLLISGCILHNFPSSPGQARTVTGVSQTWAPVPATRHSPTHPCRCHCRQHQPVSPPPGSLSGCVRPRSPRTTAQGKPQGTALLPCRSPQRLSLRYP